jgi:hypothetical protein
MNKSNLINITAAGIALGTLVISSKYSIGNSNCQIKDKHLHVYYDSQSELSEYFKGEKSSVNTFNWTSDYVLASPLNEYIAEHNLCLVKDNQDYLLNIEENNQEHFQEYSLTWIYGSYMGICYNYDPNTQELSYGYGLVNGLHYIYSWQNIPDNYVTNNKVRKVSYCYKLYKIVNNQQSSKLFTNLDNLGEYQYFNPKTVLFTNYQEVDNKNFTKKLSN